MNLVESINKELDLLEDDSDIEKLKQAIEQNSQLNAVTYATRIINAGRDSNQLVQAKQTVADLIRGTKVEQEVRNSLNIKAIRLPEAWTDADDASLKSKEKVIGTIRAQMEMLRLQLNNKGLDANSKAQSQKSYDNFKIKLDQEIAARNELKAKKASENALPESKVNEGTLKVWKEKVNGKNVEFTYGYDLNRRQYVAITKINSDAQYNPSWMITFDVVGKSAEEKKASYDKAIEDLKAKVQ